ncbi:unnamed protein product, partial [Effrenium voratum]
LLARSVLSQNGPAVRVEVSEMGREAHTEYEVLERYQVPGAEPSHEEVMLLQASPTTGRTHQIRVHMASLGRPLVGDLTYSGATWAPRLFLHCHRMEMQDLNREAFVVEEALPPDLRHVLGRLRKHLFAIDECRCCTLIQFNIDESEL